MIDASLIVDPYVVSNTEVGEYNKCERLHYYHFILGLEPRLFPLPLYRGIIAHGAMEVYYRGNRDLKGAIKYLSEEYMIAIKQWPAEAQIHKAISDLVDVFKEYHDFYEEKDKEFEVVELEVVHKTDIATGLVYGLRLDMLIKYISGKFRGDYSLVDHKFLYGFKSDIEINLNVQLPKYAKTLRENGIHVTKGFLNQIRYRPLAKGETDLSKRFRRSPIPYNKNKIDRIWEEQVDTALEIQKRRDAGVEYAEKKAKRVLNDMICKGCAYNRLCNIELEGRDPSKIIELEFAPQGTFHGYGYNNGS